MPPRVDTVAGVYGGVGAGLIGTESLSLNPTLHVCGRQRKRHEMLTYGGAPHAFTVMASERYREDADRDSWIRFTQFLADS